MSLFCTLLCRHCETATYVFREILFRFLNLELFVGHFFFNTNTGFHKKENKPFYLRGSCLS